MGKGASTAATSGWRSSLAGHLAQQLMEWTAGGPAKRFGSESPRQHCCRPHICPEGLHSWTGMHDPCTSSGRCHVTALEVVSVPAQGVLWELPFEVGHYIHGSILKASHKEGCCYCLRTGQLAGLPCSNGTWSHSQAFVCSCSNDTM